MATVGQTIDAALQMVGLINPGQSWASPSTSGVRRAAIDELNTLLNRWSVDSLNVSGQVRQTPFPLVAGTSQYTVGTGGAINIDRPAVINTVKYLIENTVDNPIEYPMYQLSDDEYASWMMKQQAGWGVAWHYRNAIPGNALGLLTVLNVPNAVSSIVLYTLAKFTVYTADAENMVLADAYEDVLRQALTLRYAVRLRHMGAKIEPEDRSFLTKELASGLAALRRLNMDRPEYQSDFTGNYGPLTPEEVASGVWLYY